MHGVFRAAGGTVHVLRRSAHRIARRKHEARPNQNDDRNLLDHDRSLCLTCETIMVLEAADCPEAERR
jgi:hypothetical protein